MKGKLLICAALGTIVCMALFIGSPYLFAESAQKDTKAGVKASAQAKPDVKPGDAEAGEDAKLEKEIEEAIKDEEKNLEKDWEAKGPHGRKRWWKKHRRCKKCIWYCKSRFDYSRHRARRCIQRHCSFYCDWGWGW